MDTQEKTTDGLLKEAPIDEGPSKDPAHESGQDLKGDPTDDGHQKVGPEPSPLNEDEHSENPSNETNESRRPETNFGVVKMTLSTELDKPLRQVRSHPSLGGRTQIPPGSLGSYPMSRSLKNNFNKTGTVAQTLQPATPSQGSLKSQKSPVEERQLRQSSPGGGGVNGIPVPGDEDEEEDGLHDTITSLAGAKMMQWYHKALTGSRKSSSVSLNQHRLEDLFLIEEDVKHEDDREEDLDLGRTLEEQVQDSDGFLEETEIFVPPDGGYGWFVALGAFIALMWTAGTVKSYGVIFESILQQFPNTSVSLASWIPASLTTLALAMAPIASALCSRYNCRNVTFVGALFCALGIGLSGFATSVEFLFLTFGLLTGIGVGLSTTPGIILVARYFNKRRGIANAFCLSGTATGSFFIPFLIEHLLEEYGFQNALVLLGGCMLHLFISGALYRPLHVHVIITRHRNRQRQTKTEDAKEIQPQQPPAPPPQQQTIHHNHSLPQFHHTHYHHHHHLHHLQQHHPLQRLPSDPNEVVSRLQTRLKLMASAETVSLCSDRESEVGHHFHSHSELHSPPVSPQTRHHDENQPHPNQRLTYQISTQPSSSFASHEDLQCHWSDSRQSINEPPTPRSQGPAGDLGPASMPETYYQSYMDVPVTSKAKALSLRELYFHQLGSRINTYTSAIFGDPSRMSRKRSAPPCQHVTGETPPPLFRNVESFVSVNSAIYSPQSKHQSVPKEEQMSKKQRNSSFIFSFEDLMTDSTCILKDTRYPTVSVRRESNVLDQFKPMNETEYESGRIVPLGRSVSVLSRRGRSEQVRRNRYISDCQSSSGAGSIFDLSTAKFQTPPPSRVASFCSNYSSAGLRRRKESSLSTAVGFDVCKDTSVISEKDEEEDLVESVSSPVEAENLFHSCWHSFSRILGLSLCEDLRFVIVVISVMSMSVGVPHVLFFLPSYTNSLHIGIDPATLLAVISVFDLLGRVAFGFIVDANVIPKFVAYAGLIFIAATSILLLPLFKDATSLFIVFSLYGLGVGGWFLMVPLLLADFFGVERIGASYGLARLFQSLSNLLGPIIAGVIRDHTGSFRDAYYFMGAVMFLGCPVVLLTPLAEKRLRMEKDSESQIMVK